MARNWWSTRWWQEPLLVYTMRELVRPLQDSDLTDEEKIKACFGDERVYKRRVLSRFSLRGQWWGADLERVCASRILEPGLFCYVREHEEGVDIEAHVQVKLPTGKKRKKWVSARDWYTCTITKNFYKTIDTNFGPVEDCCSKQFHKDDDDDWIYGYRT